jgi:hypothetical protein
LTASEASRLGGAFHPMKYAFFHPILWVASAATVPNWYDDGTKRKM